MLFLFLSVFCSVTVGVIFKIAKTYSSQASQIVFFNYLLALVLCWLVFDVEDGFLNSAVSLSSSIMLVLVLLGLLLPVVFLLLAASIRQVGIVKTDVAQRLSLIISILGAWFLYGEQFQGLKLCALLVGFPAIVLILDKASANKEKKWIYPGLVLLGFGFIDLLFKKIAMNASISFTAALGIVFLISAVVMLMINGYEFIKKGIKPDVKSLGFGLLVGLFNFGNILFYLKAHQVFADNPSTVFAGMNMGVMVLGSLIGIVFFKEKVSQKNIIGLVMALLAVVFIVASQRN